MSHSKIDFSTINISETIYSMTQLIFLQCILHSCFDADYHGPLSQILFTQQKLHRMFDHKQNIYTHIRIYHRMMICKNCKIMDFVHMSLVVLFFIWLDINSSTSVEFCLDMCYSDMFSISWVQVIVNAMTIYWRGQCWNSLRLLLKQKWIVWFTFYNWIEISHLNINWHDVKKILKYPLRNNRK
jgi:hypothetical protein